MRDGLLTRGFIRLTSALDRRRGWNHLPKPLAMLTLIGVRMRLRRENLFDTTGARIAWGPELPPPGPRSLVRSVDGTGTDPVHPEMGAAGTRFGHNVPLADTYAKDVLEPNPRLVSTELLARREFIPATTLNVLAAAWLQFQVHDWMSHGTNEPVTDEPWEIELDEHDHWPQHPMQIRRTKADPTNDGGPPTFLNTETHWWDGSQVYGSNPIVADLVRDHDGSGHLKLTPNRLIPFDPPSMIPGDPNRQPGTPVLPPDVDIAGVAGNWWLGLAMMHTLFMQEHNAICDHLAKAYPTWGEDELYHHGRLINAALMARIHTLEWTPSLLADSVMETGMKANWWGFQGEALWKRFGRLTENEEFSGIPGSRLFHHGVPYAMTEEFVAVYRMHPLIPDTYSIRSSEDDQLIDEIEFTDLAGVNTKNVFYDPRFAMKDFLYSFGVSNPGQIVLHNFPNHLRKFTEPDGTTLDLAATDILRNRERGVPRYNEFRRRFHLKPAERFEDFSTDAQVVADLRRIYRDPEAVDLMVGLYTETPPEGFAFSDTAFRVFVLMASRRLKSDRFFTYDYRPEVYTPEGIRWVEDNTMKSVLLRHYPELGEVLAGVDNAFKPWTRARAG